MWCSQCFILYFWRLSFTSLLSAHHLFFTFSFRPPFHRCRILRFSILAFHPPALPFPSPFPFILSHSVPPRLPLIPFPRFSLLPPFPIFFLNLSVPTFPVLSFSVFLSPFSPPFPLFSFPFFPSHSLFLYIFPPFSLRWHAPDPTGGPDRGAEPEPAAVRPVQRPPGAERRQPPHPSTPAARPTSPGFAAHGRFAPSSVSGSARCAGAAVPGSRRAAPGPGEAAGGRGGSGCSEPSPTAADAAPNTTAAAAANAAGHAARAGRECRRLLFT